VADPDRGSARGEAGVHHVEQDLTGKSALSLVVVLRTANFVIQPAMVTWSLGLSWTADPWTIGLSSGAVWFSNRRPSASLQDSQMRTTSRCGACWFGPGGNRSKINRLAQDGKMSSFVKRPGRRQSGHGIAAVTAE
jgi:hypothetical protein